MSRDTRITMVFGAFDAYRITLMKNMGKIVTIELEKCLFHDLDHQV